MTPPAAHALLVALRWVLTRDRFVTSDDLAQRFDVCPHTARRWLNYMYSAGYVKQHRLGSRYYWCPAGAIDS